MRIVFAALFLLAIFVGRKDELTGILDFVCDWMGYLLIILGTGLRMWSTLYIGRRKSQEIVADGPYSICRNPLYVGSMLVTSGACFCFENLLVALFALLVVLPIHVWVTIAEEKHLHEIFGEKYEEYCRTTPRFWPKLRLYRNPEEITISTRVIRRAAIDAFGFLMIPAFAEMIEFLQFSVPGFPVIFRLPSVF
jgi:protein-S-isoprenylcysteine O-methyltransferase Ste14